MQKLNSQVSDELNLFMDHDPYELIERYGSPLYVYNEKILRERIRELKNLTDYPHFQVNFSAKANSSLAILQIAREEGLHVDAMSPGEIHAEQSVGFPSDKILFITNNASEEEMQYAIDRNILVSIDSVSQLERFCRLCPGGRVAVRFNPGIGAGHHEKVITAGSDTKFAINPEYIGDVKNILKEYGVTLVGINQHIGSLFMEPDKYIASTYALLDIARHFDTLEFIDFGGGFGVPYHKQEGQTRLDLAYIGRQLSRIMHDFTAEYGRTVTFTIEPGRYIPAECSVLLGTVHAIKHNGSVKYIGTDIGFNNFPRIMTYDAHHDIEVYRSSDIPSEKNETVTIVGNICETGDILAKDRRLPEIFVEDLIGVLDAGSYGQTMSSTYNNRPRPAEVLIRENGSDVLIRRRDTLEDLIRPFLPLPDSGNI